MLKKLFYILGLSVFFSLAYFSVHLFHTEDRVHFTQSIYLQQLWEMKAEEVNISQGTTKMQAFGNTSLLLCPNTAPNLVGPLHVDFNAKLSLDEVRDAVGSPLQEGGRYKPPNCTARHKVAIIIPFRNRHEHLKYWLYYLHPILARQQLDYGVYVVNQDGDKLFNRGKLMNIGFVEALKEYDYECFVFSDIDLIPIDDRNIYGCFDKPRHLSVAIDKFNYHLPYSTIFGGVCSFSKNQFLKINGFSNSYAGWGGEDDDIYKRIIFRGMSISRPDFVTGKYKMIKHKRDLHNENNPNSYRLLAHTHRDMKQDGINSLKYTVKEIVRDQLYTFITVDINVPPS